MPDAPLLRMEGIVKSFPGVRALRGVDLRCQDFSWVLHHADRGDVVYFDPPYVPTSASGSFTGYTRGGFGQGDQVRLRDVAVALKRRGVFVLISNSAAPMVRELYAEAFDCVDVCAPRSISCHARRRGSVQELLMT